MLSVALTGGIGTGKSVALARFAELGTPVVEADALARDAIAPGTPGAAAVRLRFGDGVIGPEGQVDRSRLAALVFTDEQARRDLEAIVHPAVYRAIHEWMRAQEASGARMAIAEIPLLFETGREGDFACVVVTACAEAEQVRRAMARTSLSETEVRRRIEAQGPLDDNVRRADYVIWTDGTVEDTRVRAAAVWEALNPLAIVGYS
jgi:dephospho-CoA kinase